MSSIFAPDLLADRVCIVSGAGTGLGRAAASELAGLGATVVLCGRRRDRLEDTAARIGARASVHPLDIRDEDAVDALMDEVVERFGRIDVLVNNAGGQFMAPAEEVSPKGFRTVVELNAQGTWQMTRAAALKSMIPNRSGRVINVTLSPHNGFPGLFHAARRARLSRT
ncbi:SDR family NAD(P)-dependent oxidoreductase [Tsukamurella sp. PLM1]|uniref:SDR family NAD(P)-dependent oxidoreductase n=1 Tax=Tsukamurella sp. PLM1 TaxID=2929795 RepID=UPI00204A65C2|nr:SDR family NAD(P)-dependent oxidoreductase [Tsukamurella sp. PLM1]BDH59658.1 hypothetical protein MTP03_45970 [Tsukamurella sp. PLM1]